MEQKKLVVTIRQEIQTKTEKEIGVLTWIQTDERYPDGRLTPYRSFCSYEIKKAEELPGLLRKLRRLKIKTQSSVLEGRDT